MPENMEEATQKVKSRFNSP